MDTLCWDCRNATRDVCAWAKDLKPVKGWSAEQGVNGHIVYECPLFERSTYGFGQYRTREEYIEHLRKRAEREALGK